MSINVEARSFVSVTKETKSPDVTQNEKVIVPRDSFKVISKIANSSRLSDGEKSSLISNVALVDKYAKGSLRKKMLNTITATTLFLERHGKPNTTSEISVNKALKQFNNISKSIPNISSDSLKSQQQVAQLEKTVTELPNKVANTSIENIKNTISNEKIAAVFNTPISKIARNNKINVSEVKPLGSNENKRIDIQDTVNISSNAKIASELTLPGSASNTASEIKVLGSSDFENITLPGGGNTDNEITQEQITTDIERRIAALESRDIPELILPGGDINTKEVADEIITSPKQAIKSIGNLNLPGSYSAENGSVNDKAIKAILNV